MPHLGDFALGVTFDYKFTTRAADGTPTTPAGSPAVVVYEDNSTTEITSAETLTTAFDTRAGLNNLRVVCSSGNGFGAGQSYAAVFSAGTVDGTTVVGETICTWTIEKASALRPITDGRELDVDANNRVDVGSWLGTAVTSGTGGPDVNVNAISDDTTAAVNLEADYDGTGYTKSASTINTATNVTNSVTAGTVSDKTGYSLSSTGLDAITQAATGMVEIAKAVWDRVLTSGTHNISNSAGKRLRDIQEQGSVYGGYVWIDTVNGTAGTDNYVNGTSDNPVDTIGDANTLAASLGITRFKVAPGSSITFAATQSNQLFEGSSWTLVLGSRNIDGSTIVGASVSGVATNTSDTQYFINCEMNACTLPGDTHTIGCSISGTQTVGEAGDYFWSNCYSGVAGAGTPVLDINSVANVNINWRHYSGGLQVNNAVSTTAMSYESDGQLVIAATCTSLTVSIRGNCSLTDSGTTSSITDDARINTTQINDEVLDVLNTDTFAEPGQEAPGATVTLATKIGYLYKAFRNRSTSTSSEITLYNDDAVTVDQKWSHSDDSTTYDRGEAQTGP